MRTVTNWGYWLLYWLRSGAAWLFSPERRVQSVVLLLAIATVLIVAAQSVQNQLTAGQEHSAAVHLQRITACQTRYNETIARITKIRADLTDQDRAATKALNLGTSNFILGVVTPTPNLDQAQKLARFLRLTDTYHKVVVTYTQTEASIDTQRAEHPLPALPSGACR